MAFAVSLVCMPWHVPGSPSIQLGILQALLRHQGLECHTHSVYLDFLRFATDPSVPGALSLAEFLAVGEHWFTAAPGAWVFARATNPHPDALEERRYLRDLRRAGMPSSLVKRLRHLRARVDAFLAECADEILAVHPQVVGFTTTFGQTVASVALAAELKRRAPNITVVFGGADCEGAMGEALHRSYPCIDIVVRGEGEPVLPEVIASLAQGRRLPRVPGVCFRADNQQVIVPGRKESAVAMDDVPIPVYDEYFARLTRLALDRDLSPTLPFESARGCWWGAKSHCTFCGLNGQLLKHRSKSGDRVVAELTTLAERHAVLDFTVVDNILDRAYFATVLPALARSEVDRSLFYQVKANLRREQVRLLRDAGVRSIRPGIESLSTPILARMRKGVTALQNIRLLRWCAEHGVHVAWNIIHGIPGETAADYARMTDVAASLAHLAPPSIGALTLDRFSPYAAQPSLHGIRVLGAPRHYRSLYGVDDATRRELAWTFEFAVDGLPAGDYVAPLREIVARWRADSHRNRGALTFRRGPTFLVIDDARTTTGRRRFVLDRVEAALYLACDAGCTAEAAAAAATRACDRVVRTEEAARPLRQFVAERLMYEEDGRFLALAIATVAAPEVTPTTPHATASGALG